MVRNKNICQIASYASYPTVQKAAGYHNYVVKFSTSFQAKLKYFKIQSQCTFDVFTQMLLKK